jgi:hypothetical protein
MTAQYRPLLLPIAATALFLPACLTFSNQSGSIGNRDARDTSANTTAAEPARKDLFHELPSRPGESVAINPTTKTETVGADVGTKRLPDRPPPSPPPPSNLNAIGNPPGLFPSGPASPIPQCSTESPLPAAVRAFAENQPDKAGEILKSLDTPNREFVASVAPVLAKGATANLGSDPAAASALLEQLRAATAQLESLAALRIENVTFCGKVAGFGRYDPWPQGQPYRPNDQAQLYLEVRNLRSRPATGPNGETHLTHARASVEVRDAHGRLIEQPDPEDWRRRVSVVKFEKKLYSRGPLNDFHILYPVAVPSSPGVYTVTVEVRDGAGRRVTRAAPAEFRVGGP